MVDENGTRAADRSLEVAERPTVAAESFAVGEDVMALSGQLTGLRAGQGGPKRYELAGILGEGGMGEVHACNDLRIGRQVAMKVMRKDTPASPETCARFLHEARVQGQTEHPSIVPVYDVGTDEAGSLYFTMRRVEGKTLEDILDGLRTKTASFEHEYSRHKLLTTFGSACLAVHFAHTRSVFHCDLKPANLMLGAFGEMYVLDWGLATGGSVSVVSPLAAASDGAEKRTVSGTPGYMAPEQIRGEAPDARSDVYALGALLYEILTLTPMHRGKTPRDLCMATLQGEIDRPSARAPDRDVPPELEAICMRATVHAKSRRYASARELYDDLERYLEGDRDLAMRRAMSREHAVRAASLAERACADVPGASEATTARSEALRIVSRALALDPDNPDALRTLVKLLTQPPREMPPEALEDMRAAERGLDRARSRAGAMGVVLMSVIMPLACVYYGLRDLRMFALNAAVGLSAAVASIVRIRRPRRDGYAPAYVAFAVALGVAALGLCFSPVLVTANVAVPLAMGFTLSMDRRRRFLPLTAMAAALALPFVLEWTHVIAPAQAMVGALLCAVPRMTGFPPPGSSMLLVANLVPLLGGCFFSVRFRGVLTDLQRSSAVAAWQLRQLLPREAGPATMPPPAP